MQWRLDRVGVAVGVHVRLAAGAGVGVAAVLRSNCFRWRGRCHEERDQQSNQPLLHVDDPFRSL
jgi:hypothetical protein